jgi:hypothetical protein
MTDKMAVIADKVTIALLLIELGILHSCIAGYLHGDDTREDLLDAVGESQERLEKIIQMTNLSHEEGEDESR